MSVNQYQVGDYIRMSGNFTDVSCTPTNPSSIELRVVVGSADTTYTWPPSGDIVQSDTGSFYHDHAVNSPGEHFYYWRGYGAAIAAEYHAFMVHTPPTPFLGS